MNRPLPPATVALMPPAGLPEAAPAPSLSQQFPLRSCVNCSISRNILAKPELEEPESGLQLHGTKTKTKALLGFCLRLGQLRSMAATSVASGASETRRLWHLGPLLGPPEIHKLPPGRTRRPPLSGCKMARLVTGRVTLQRHNDMNI